MDTWHIRFSRQIGVASVASASIYLRNILLIPVLTRVLGESDYGIWVQVFACSELLLGVSLLGLTQALMRYLPERRDGDWLADDLASILTVALGAGLALTALAWHLSAFGADLFLGGAANAPALQAACALVPVSIVSSWVLAYFRASRRVLLYSGLLLAESIGYVILAIVLVLDGLGVLGVIGALLALRVAVSAVGGTVILRQVGLRVPTFACLRPYLAFGLPLIPLGVFTWVTSIGDRFVLSHFYSTEVSGVYSVSYGLGSLVGLFFSPLFFVLGPALAELWQREDRPAVREHLLYAQKYPLLLAVPATVVLSAYSRQIIELWATAKFAAHPAIVVLTALGTIACNLSAIVETALGLAYRTRVIPVIYLSSAGVNLTANLLVVPLWGMVGAAATTLLAYGLQASLMYVHIRRHFPFTWNLAFAGRAAAAAVPMAACLFASSGRSVAAQVAGLLAGVGVFYGTLAALGGFERREWDLVRRLVGVRDRG